MQSEGFEPSRVSTIELESIALDRSAMIANTFKLQLFLNTKIVHSILKLFIYFSQIFYFIYYFSNFN